jgi:phenylacetate-CoA ligase
MTANAGSPPELSVIAPCFNEQDNLRELVDRTLRVFDRKGIRGELVLVDDGSSDATAEVIRGLQSRHAGRVCGVFHPSTRGIEEGWRSGLAASTGKYVCLIDADLQYQPEDVYRLFREIRFSNVDVVQGVRSHIGRLKDNRYTLSVGLNRILNLCFGMRARDSKSGFVLTRHEVLAEILRHRHRYHYFQTFITVAATARGYSVREVETLFESRIHGQSFMTQRVPWKVVLASLVDIVKAIHEYRWNRYRDLVVEHFVREKLPREAPGPVHGPLRRLYFRVYQRLMPLHHWMITKNAGYYYRVLDRSQWLPPAAIREMQEEKLRRLIQHVYWHVPFYREAMDGAGVRPEDIRSLEDLRRMPVLEKADIRENLYFDLMSDSHRKRDVLRVTTSGSTGQPLTVWADRHQLEYRWAATLRSQEWTGYRFGDRTVRLWHQTIGMDRSQVFKERLDALLSRRKFVPAFELNDRGVQYMERVIRRHLPTLVDGYAESFNYLAKHGVDPALRSLGIRGLMSSAQTLDDSSRKRVQEAFGSQVFDKYGSREFSGIAYECAANDGHHVVAECYHVEILVEGRPAKPGELGEVLITDLNNYVMPLIRYRIGDLAYAMDDEQTCRCGRGLPRIGAVEGRVQSMVVGANGVAMPSSFFLHVLKDYSYAVERFQVEQTTPGKIVFRYVPAGRFHPRVLEEVYAVFRSYLGEEMEIRSEPVERIEMVHTGKFRSVINHMQIDYQDFDNVLDPRSVSGG